LALAPTFSLAVATLPRAAGSAAARRAALCPNKAALFDRFIIYIHILYYVIFLSERDLMTEPKMPSYHHLEFSKFLQTSESHSNGS
jgi:hypothetical protein